MTGIGTRLKQARIAAGLTQQQLAARAKLTSEAVSAFWAKLSPEERSAEMKRRAKVRNQNRARKAKSS